MIEYKTQSNIIDSFSGENEFLSNFYSCSVIYHGVKYLNSEAAFQAQKDPSRREEFVNLNPSEAKRLGRKVSLRVDWDQVKDNIMKEILYCKFLQNTDLKQKLIDTYPNFLMEGNTWHDMYWGVCNGLGLNKLGQLLMNIREEFMNESN